MKRLHGRLRRFFQLVGLLITSSPPHLELSAFRRIKALDHDRGKLTMVWYHLRLGHDVDDRKILPGMKQSPGTGHRTNT